MAGNPEQQDQVGAAPLDYCLTYACRSFVSVTLQARPFVWFDLGGVEHLMIKLDLSWKTAAGCRDSLAHWHRKPWLHSHCCRRRVRFSGCLLTRSIWIGKRCRTLLPGLVRRQEMSQSTWSISADLIDSVKQVRNCRIICSVQLGFSAEDVDEMRQQFYMARPYLTNAGIV